MKSSDTTFFLFFFSFQVPFIFQGPEQVFENRGRAIMNNFSQTLNGDDHNAKKSEKTEKRKEVSGGFFPQGSRCSSRIAIAIQQGKGERKRALQPFDSNFIVSEGRGQSIHLRDGGRFFCCHSGTELLKTGENGEN